MAILARARATSSGTTGPAIRLEHCGADNVVGGCSSRDFASVGQCNHDAVSFIEQLRPLAAVGLGAAHADQRSGSPEGGLALELDAGSGAEASAAGLTVAVGYAQLRAHAALVLSGSAGALVLGVALIAVNLAVGFEG
jgi:hypothetical protein